MNYECRREQSVALSWRFCSDGVLGKACNWLLLHLPSLFVCLKSHFLKLLSFLLNWQKGETPMVDWWYLHLKAVTQWSWWLQSCGGMCLILLARSGRNSESVAWNTNSLLTIKVPWHWIWFAFIVKLLRFLLQAFLSFDSFLFFILQKQISEDVFQCVGLPVFRGWGPKLGGGGTAFNTDAPLSLEIQCMKSWHLPRLRMLLCLLIIQGL